MKLDVRSMCYSTMFLVLIIISTYIKLPISIVPITMQTFSILLCGLVLGRKLGVFTVGLYIFMGLIGLPVFASGGGFAYVFQPSFGYLLGFLVMALFVGGIKQSDSMMKTIVTCLLGVIALYVIGIAYFIVLQAYYFHNPIDMQWIFYFLFLVYLPGDIISLVLASIISKRIRPIV